MFEDLLKLAQLRYIEAILIVRLSYYLPSGARRDGLAMHHLCPIAMLFIPCKDGLSHHPDEAIAYQHAQAVLDVLVQFLQPWRVEV